MSVDDFNLIYSICLTLTRMVGPREAIDTSNKVCPFCLQRSEDMHVLCSLKHVSCKVCYDDYNLQGMDCPLCSGDKPSDIYDEGSSREEELRDEELRTVSICLDSIKSILSLK
mmetsp:Transcript_14035/g.26290  ORF Transcript_14035/g.26290 Transcript_14035/m.26290 type:complete len:113 (+) Transcript_14035:239-577(+)